MKKAIATSYAEEQNEPSCPLRRLIEVPTKKQEREELLKRIFIEHVCDVEPEELTVKHKKGAWGDLSVDAEDLGLHLYLTYIEE